MSYGIRILAAALGVCLALGACGGGETQSDSIVEVAKGEAVQARAMFSFTGASSQGETLRRAVDLAVEDFSGGIHGYEVAFGETLDSGCSTESGGDAARQVAADARVAGVIGTTCSVAAVGASPILSAAGLSMISPSNTSPALTSDLAGNEGPDYHPGYFRISNNDLYNAPAVADFAYEELGLRRMATLHDGDTYTSGMAAAFGEAYTELGGEVAAAESISKGDTDMSGVLSRFAAAAADGVFFPIFAPEGEILVRQAREMEALDGVTLIGGGALVVADFLSAPETEGVYLAGPESVFTGRNSATGMDASEVLAAFEAAYGESPPSPYWAHTYDATTMLLTAIRNVAVKEEGNILTRALGLADERLIIDRAEIRKVMGRDGAQNLQGLTGEIRCDEFGDCGEIRVNIYRHTDASITDPALLEVVYRFDP